MRSDSLRNATCYTAMIATAASLALWSGCKSRDPAPTKRTHAPTATAPAAKHSEAPEFHVRPEPTFELPEDIVIDPAEELRAMRHNCCDETPVPEIEAATHADGPGERDSSRARGE